MEYKVLKYFKYITLSLSLFFVCYGFSQNVTVKGTVIDAKDGQPIPGVNVIISGSSEGTSTNIDGVYEINTTIGSTLVFSYIGMQDVLQVISKQSHNIVMEESLTGLDEVVVIGYGTMKKRELYWSYFFY